MVSISAVIITYNEERNIGRCVDSLRGIADEILVMDSFSTDRTKEICEARNVRFETHVFDGFAFQKNRANAMAKYDVILSLDADEALSDTLSASLLQAKKNFNAEGYSLNRLTNYCGRWIRHCGWYPDAKVRLFDRRKAQWAGGKVHEYLKMDMGSKKAHLEGDLLHYSFYTVEQHMDTINKFSTLKAEQAFADGKRPRLVSAIFGPPLKFLKMYVIKAGFLDGFQGLCIAANSAHAVFLKHAKLRILYKSDRATEKNAD